MLCRPNISVCFPPTSSKNPFPELLFKEPTHAVGGKQTLMFGRQSTNQKAIMERGSKQCIQNEEPELQGRELARLQPGRSPMQAQQLCTSEHRMVFSGALAEGRSSPRLPEEEPPCRGHLAAPDALPSGPAGAPRFPPPPPSRTRTRTRLSGGAVALAGRRPTVQRRLRLQRGDA